MKSVAKSLWETFGQYGTPKILQTDNGPEFANKIIACLAEIYGIDRRLITAYNSRANGLVERKNKEISRAIKKFTEGAAGHWKDWLAFVQIGLNNAINKKTGSTPFSLMFGRPFNGFGNFSNTQTPENIDNILAKRGEKWKIYRETVLPGILDRTKEVKKAQEFILNKRKQIAPLLPGTHVMAMDVTRSSKWAPVYEGPFIIGHQSKGGAYQLLDLNGGEISPKRVISMLVPVDSLNSMDLPSEGDRLQQHNKNLVISKTKKHFEVEKIVKHRFATPKSNGYEYFTKWKKYPHSKNTWEPESNFDSLETIRNY